jgi:c-di-GMP-binding flagellar brake protein YcgR
MESVQKIVGEDVFDAINSLIEEKTLIRIQLRDRDNERLTVISDLRKIDNKPFFQIDLTEGMQEFNEDGEDEGNAEDLKFIVEFSGKDRLTYRFTAEKAIWIGKNIWAQFPECIHRIQKRSNFRIRAPQGSKILFTIDDKNHRLNVDNISLGGAFVYFQGRLNRADLYNGLEAGNRFCKVSLAIPTGAKITRINIRDCFVTRVEKNPAKGHYGIGLQFSTISKQEKRVLTDVIYTLQREYLKRRLK